MTSKTINHYKTAYLNECGVRGIKEHTLNTYDFVLGKFVDRNSEVSPTTLNEEQYNDFVLNLKGRGYKSGSISLYSVILKQFYLYLIEAGVIDTNPKRLNTYKNTEPEYTILKQKDIQNLKRVCDRHPRTALRDKAVISLLADSGLRASELCGLNRNDLKIGTKGLGTISLKGKRGRKRTIYFTHRTRQAINTYLANRRDDKDALFLSSKGKGERMTRMDLYFMIVRKAKEAGLSGVSPHTLRHYTATEMLRRGANTSIVQQIMGHEDIKTTQKYTHIVNEDVARAYAEIM